MDEMLEAERLAEALEGTVVTHEVTRGLASMAHELGGTLRQPLLDPHDRAHIHAAMMRLVESGAPAIRPATWHRVPVTRRQGAVLGGVAAASLVAAIGYAVMHERHKTRRAVAAA